MFELMKFISNNKVGNEKIEKANYFGHNLNYLNQINVLNMINMYSNDQYGNIAFPCPVSDSDVIKLFGCILYVCMTGKDEIDYDFSNNIVIAKFQFDLSRETPISKVTNLLKELLFDDHQYKIKPTSHYLHDVLKEAFGVITLVKDMEAITATSQIEIKFPYYYEKKEAEKKYSNSIYAT